MCAYCLIGFLCNTYAEAKDGEDSNFRNKYTNTEVDNFWFLDPPPSYLPQIRPGVVGGNKSRYYIDNLWPVAGTFDTVIFLNPKYTVTDDSDAHEVNVGIGVRHLFNNDTLLLGGNFYYDTRLSEHNVRQNQLGFGFEILTKWVDGRTNFYYPISKRKRIEDGITYGMVDRSIMKFSTIRYEEALRGLDYEIGVLLPFISDFMETRAFVGGYNYFPNDGNDINGFRARVEIRPVEAFTIDIELTKDNRSPVEAYVGGYFSLQLPFGRKGYYNNSENVKESFKFGKKGPRSLRKRMSDPVKRDIDVITQIITTETSMSKFRDIIFVDNSNDPDPSQDGTREHPWDEFDDAFTDPIYAEGVWIFIDDGDGTDVGYTGNYTLANDVTLWGSGYDAGVYGITVSGIEPIINGGGAGSTITLADGNEVMGLRVTNAGDFGLYGQNISNVSIHHNTFDNNGVGSGGTIIGNIGGTDIKVAGGVFISNTTSDNLNVSIYENIANSNGLVGTVDVNTMGSGIFLANMSGNTGGITTSIYNNTASDNGAIGIGVSTVLSEADLNATITNNVVERNGLSYAGTGNSAGIIAINAGADNNTMNFSATGNTINQNATGLLSMIADNGNRSNSIVSLSGNDVNNSTGSGLSVAHMGTSAETSGTLVATITNNTGTNNGNPAVAMEGGITCATVMGSANSSTMFTINNNQMDNNSVGISAVVGNIDPSGVAIISIDGNSVTNNEVSGISVGSFLAGGTPNSTVLTASITNNTATNNGSLIAPGLSGAIIAVTFQGTDSVTDLTITGNTIDTAPVGIMLFDQQGTNTTTRATISGNNAINTGLGSTKQTGGMQAAIAGGTNAYMELDVNNNTMNNNNYGISFGLGDCDINTEVVANISDNIVNNNASSGIGAFSIATGGGIDNYATVRGVINNNEVINNGHSAIPGSLGGYGIIGYTLKCTDDTMDLDITNNTATDNLYAGIGVISSESQGGSNMTADISGNICNNNGNVASPEYGFGVWIQSRSTGIGSVFNTTVVGNTMDGNLHAGIGIATTEAAIGSSTAMTSVISNNTITNNGVNYVGAGGSLSIVSGGIVIWDAEQGSDNYTFSNNTITDNANNVTNAMASGIGIFGASPMQATLTGNTISNNGTNLTAPVNYYAGGVTAVYNGGAGDSLAITATGNTIDANGLNPAVTVESGNVLGVLTSTGGIDIMGQSNVITNGQNGINVINGGAGTITTDLGAGAFGSLGQNSIYGNTVFDITNTGASQVSAQFNWWGQTPPVAGQFNGLANYTNWLNSDPN